MKTEKEIKDEIERLEKNLSIMDSSVEELDIRLENINNEPWRGFEDNIRKQHEIEAISTVKSSMFMNMYKIEAQLDVLHYILGLEPYKYKHN